MLMLKRMIRRPMRSEEEIELDKLSEEEAEIHPDLATFLQEAEKLGIIDGALYQSPLGNAFRISREHWKVDISGNIVQYNVGAQLLDGRKIGEFVYLGLSRKIGEIIEEDAEDIKEDTIGESDSSNS